jgi:hypothetical protein
MITKENADQWGELIQALKDGELQLNLAPNEMSAPDWRDTDKLEIFGANWKWYRRKPKPKLVYLVWAGGYVGFIGQGQDGENRAEEWARNNTWSYIQVIERNGGTIKEITND